MVRCPECPGSPESLDVDWHPDPPDDRPWLICSQGHAFVKEQPTPPPVASPERHPAGGPVCAPFDHNDAGYLAWTREWPRGYVVNCYRHPSPDCVVLHRAYCHQITVLDPGATTFTCGDYIKVCSTSRHLVDQWARENTGVPASTGCHCVN